MRARTFASLAERNYALFYAGQILSLTGAWVERPALQNLAYEITGHDERWIGWIGVIPLVPTVLVSIPAGALIDRRDPHRVVVWTQALMMLGAAVMGLVVLSGAVTIWHVAAYAAYSSGVFAVDAAARQSLLVHLVPRERLMNAIALNASMFSVARFAGGAVYSALSRAKLLGDGGCILLNAMSFAFVIVGLFLMRLSIAEKPRTQGPSQLWEGVRFASRTPQVRAALLMICVLSMFGFQLSHLFPVYAEKVWDVDRAGLGDLHTAAGLGAFVGSLTLATRVGDVHRGKMMFWYGSVAALCLAAFGSVPPFGAALVVLAAGNFLLTQAQSAGNAIIQSAVPDDLRGRVMSLYTLAVLASFPIGGFLGGFSAKGFGAPATTIADAAVILAAVAVIAFTHPMLRRAR